MSEKKSHVCQRLPFPKSGLVTKSQVADFLGLSIRSIERLTADGVLPVIKLPTLKTNAIQRFVRYDATVIRSLFSKSEAMQQPSIGGVSCN